WPMGTQLEWTITTLVIGLSRQVVVQRCRRRFGCTTCGTAGRRWRSPPGSTRRWSRSGSDTPTSASRSTFTATSRQACTTTPLSGSLASSSALV
ncbi:MAG: hypothetical protein AVDCRST_MAG29-2103, partial [uncultured Nocardioidaceae bacterium]